MLQFGLILTPEFLYIITNDYVTVRINAPVAWSVTVRTRAAVGVANTLCDLARLEAFETLNSKLVTG